MFDSSVQRWSRAADGPHHTALFKSTPETFEVVEELPFSPCGEGEHLFLRITKRAQNTVWVASQLARIAAVAQVDVSYAGMKDRQGVTTQWFSLRLPGKPGPQEFEQWAAHVAGIDGLQLLELSRHHRKLRIGSLRGNHFRILLHEVSGSREGLESTLQRIASHGVPNYYGCQRFGRNGSNLAQARQLFAGSCKRINRQKRSLALSAARSFLFNTLVDERVNRGNWRQLLPGDVLTFPDSASLILPCRRDDSTPERFDRGELLTTGPLWGCGTLLSAGSVAQLEMGVADGLQDFADGLQKWGLKQERRALILRVENLKWNWSQRSLELNFFLGKGGYATAVLRELIEAHNPEKPDVLPV